MPNSVESIYLKIVFPNMSTMRLISQSAVVLVKTASAFSDKKFGEEEPDKCLIVKTMLNFKFNGLFCHCCMHKLKRVKAEKEHHL